MKILIELFISFFQIGLFSIGGGYAAMPLIQAQTVDIKHWLSLTEFADLVTIAEMTPGPIAINAATFVGMKVAGVPGVLFATLGNVLPPFIIIIILAKLYQKYSEQKLLKNILENVRPVVVATIFTAGLSLLQLAVGSLNFTLNSLDLFGLIVFILSFFILNSKKLRISPILLLIAGALAGITFKWITDLVI